MIAAIRRWAAEELRLIRADTWAAGTYAGAAPCTAADPRCQATLARLADVRESMRRVRSTLLCGKGITSSAHTNLRETFEAVRAGTPSGQ